MSVDWITEFVCYFVPESDNSLHKDMDEGYYFRTEDEQLEGSFLSQEEAEKNLQEYLEYLG